jgi:glutamate-1-semialdehyde aminotransferase
MGKNHLSPEGCNELLEMASGLLGRELSPEEKDAIFLGQRAGGAVIQDLSGRSFYDLTSGGGTCLLGFAAPKIQAALLAGLAQGLPRTAWQAGGIEVACRLRELFGRPDRVVLCAGARAARESAAQAARHATGREGIIMIGGGTPVTGNVCRVAPGDMSALEKELVDNSHAIAALLVEPLCPESMTPEDVKALGQRACELGVLFILD